MFEQLRRKRMLIEESVNGRRNDREGMSSLERRKMVEKDLTQYNQLLNKTMQDFRRNQPQAENNTVNPNKTVNQLPYREDREVRSEEQSQMVVTPSVKDIAPAQQEQSALANEFYELSADANKEAIIFSPNKNISNFYKKQPAPPSPKAEINIHSMEEQSSHRSELQIEDEEIRMPKIANSSRTESNNNSEAIFFTSHFKEMMNNDVHSPPKPAPEVDSRPPPIELADNKVEEREGTARFEQGLQNNPSGQSLAISNDSSLKYSLNESAIQDIITRKLSNELVVDSLSPTHQGITTLSTGLLLREHIKDFVEFARTHHLALLVQDNKIKSVFMELKINKQLKFQVRNRDIKAASFLGHRHSSLLQGCFHSWRAIVQAKQDRIQSLLAGQQRQTLQKCFKTLKMLLFDRRINHQIDMYYLSKIFQAFRSATERETKRSNQKAYRLYFKHLKRRMFQAFIEGCYNSRRENAGTENALNHYYYSLIRKYFEGWRGTTPKEEKFIRLAVTTTNVMKETDDHRLLHTKTFDFYEVR